MQPAKIIETANEENPMKDQVIWRKSVTHPAEGKYPGFGYRVEPHDEFIIERDIAIPMRDNTKLYADLIRPRAIERAPVIVTYSPYGKHGLKKFLFSPESGVPPGSVSKYAVWEGPDPEYFVPHGYAVLNVDARGSWYSEGDLTIWSDQEAQDGYDVIEWAAKQPWSTGKVGMSGVSYLAIVQWRVAALNPPHLAAINPWEGWSDCYRERGFHGGIPETKMVPWAQWSTSFSLTRSEEFVETAKAHPLLDDYWKGKSADLSKITAPAYIVADWGDQGLHTRGTIEGFRQASSKYKWLEVHGRKKWQYYYQESSRERLRIFFDHFLKGASDEVLAWPRVRIEVRKKYYEGAMRDEKEWPLARLELTPLYLDAGSRKMTRGPVANIASAAYDAKTGNISFTHTFAEATEISGYMKLRLWIEARGSNDADLFVSIEKLDCAGGRVPFTFMTEFDNGPVALGWLRVSHRELDPERSTPDQPRHTHVSEQLLSPGEIVPVDIEIWPSATLFEAGESIQVIIQGRDIYGFPTVRHTQMHEDLRNAGEHVLYAGGEFDSHLLIPVIPDQI
jgi:predicted acyl esterase